jgi:hypothetical protein
MSRRVPSSCSLFFFHSFLSLQFLSPRP